MIESNIALIGGSGFLGGVLSRKINSDRNFIYDIKPSLDFPNNYTYLDVTDINDLYKHLDGNHVIINLAAEHKDNVKPKSRYHKVNVEGAKNICDVATKKNIKCIIFVSSVAVYGFSDEIIDESHDLAPISDYGSSKAMAEEIYKKWQLEDPLRRSLVIIRPTVIFGPNNRGNLYNLIAQINKNRFLMVGTGLNIKSLAFVENITDFIIFSMRFGPGCHLYNYVDEPQLTMNALVGSIYNYLGKKAISIRIPYFFGMIFGYFFDMFSIITGKNFSISSIRIKKFCSNSRFKSAVSESGFKVKYSLEVALEKFITSEFDVSD